MGAVVNYGLLRIVTSKMAMQAAEYKIILLGDPGVGKTTFFLRLKQGEFVDTEELPTATLGVDNMEYVVKTGGTEIKVGSRHER